MSIILGIITGIAIIVLTTYLLWLKRTNYVLSGLKAIDGPNNYPFIGGVLEFLPTSETIWKLKALHEKYGKTFKAALSYIAGIVTIDVHFIEYILTSGHCVNKSLVYEWFRNSIGDGLLISKSDKWHKRRKMITPAFHFKLLEEFVDVFNMNEMVLIEQLEKAVEKEEPIDVWRYVALCAFDNINETAMGTSVNAQLNEDNAFVKGTKCVTELICKRIISPYKFLDILYAFTADCRLEKKEIKIGHNYCLAMIKARRDKLLNHIEKENKMASKSSTDDDDDDFGIKQRTAFLDILLQSTIDGQHLTTKDILDEVVTFMVGGFDTVGAAASFTLFCISKYPTVQAKIIEEQRRIYFNDPTRNTTLEDIKSMPYLEMVIKESMRLYPPVPVIGRVAMEDFYYRNLHVRKGTEMLIPIYAVHKDPDLYPEPEKFDPERFAPENQSRRHPFAYLAFSAGKRNCIGQKFGMLETKSIVSRVLRHFEVSPTIPEHKLVLPSAVLLHSASGVYINIKKRVW